jgi:dihydrofolate reductase
MLSSDMSGE